MYRINNIHRYGPPAHPHRDVRDVDPLHCQCPRLVWGSVSQAFPPGSLVGGLPHQLPGLLPHHLHQLLLPDGE